MASVREVHIREPPDAAPPIARGRRIHLASRGGRLMTKVNGLKDAAWSYFDEKIPEWSAFHRRIWEYAEPAWREYRSADAYVALLRREGFEVEAGTGGMPTAFRARWGSGSPVLGTFAEYDAVPQNSQAAVPRREPRPGFHPYAPGHTDPHSALGVAALSGILA